MKHTPIRTVIVGSGSFGTKRLEACLLLKKDFLVIGVIDKNPIRRKEITSRYAIPTYESIYDLHQKGDLAIIATPNTHHVTESIKALKLGFHVLCEKPLATNSKEAKKIILAAKKYHKYVKTGSNHRFFYTVQKARELYENGEIGDLLLFKGSIGINGKRVSQKWFWDKNISGGGTFIDNGCHLIDLARTFMGDFTSCTAAMSTNFWKKTNVEDVGTAIYKTRDNKQAIITASWIQWAGYLHIELWGKKGYIIIDSTTHDTVTVGGKDGIFRMYDYSNEPKDSYHRELLYMADCIRNKKEPSPNAKDGTKVIELIEYAYKASARPAQKI